MQPNIIPPDSIAAEHRQLVVVTAPNDSSITGTMYRFDRNADGSWQKRSEHPVTLGRTGLIWGDGLYPKLSENTPKKHEGDGKSPAGIFTFGTAFGYAPPGTLSLKLPYVHVTDITQCIEKSESAYYNQVLQRDTVAHIDWDPDGGDWMRRKDDLYKWGVFVNHNTPATAGNGSCIFFHIWRGPDRHTAGCTAMTEQHIISLITWLDPSLNPLLVQLTADEYAKWQPACGLPAL